MNYRNSKRNRIIASVIVIILVASMLLSFITCSILGHNILKQRMGVKLIRRSAS